ncbi:MAG: AmmeMemoRadiSam system radical SAM enzyme [Kiritimatiellae bacterium]|nr:AmmeMemoRadiSam system radical SAM enzyme [Kiritimatiellia bacterium]
MTCSDTRQHGDFTRRRFLSGCAAAGMGAAFGGLWPAAARAAPPRRDRRGPPVQWKEAMFWEPAGDGRVRCTTCPNMCVRAEGEVTYCNTRINRGGKLYTLTYGRPCVISSDPLEKNPLFHVEPGSSAVATATAGCNLRCTYCQNWDIALVGPDRTRNMALSPEELVKRVKDRGLNWLTFTYTEPTAYYEYAVIAARIARREGVKVAVVSAGFINPKPLETLMACADAFSVTLKGYTQEFYREVCAGNLADVLRTLRTLARSRCWLEVVTLIVPQLNDDPAGLRSLAQGIAKMNPDIPLHFLRFYPAHKLQHLPQTPVQTLETAHATARAAGLNYVYVSNLPGHRAGNTYCPKCGRTLIQRVAFKVLSNEIRDGRCPGCGQRIPGVGLG